MIRERGYRSVSGAQGTTLYRKKMKAISRLNRDKVKLRARLKSKARSRHLQHADTDRFNQQFGNGPGCKTSQEPLRLPPDHRIPERNQVIELTCTATAELTADEQFTRQCACITTWVKLQRRQEAPRRGSQRH